MVVDSHGEWHRDRHTAETGLDYSPFQPSSAGLVCLLAAHACPRIAALVMDFAAPPGEVLQTRVTKPLMESLPRALASTTIRKGDSIWPLQPPFEPTLDLVVIARLILFQNLILSFLTPMSLSAFIYPLPLIPLVSVLCTVYRVTRHARNTFLV